MISKGASGSLPGWKLTGAPVASWANALATMAFFSNSEMECLQIWCFYTQQTFHIEDQNSKHENGSQMEVEIFFHEVIMKFSVPI